jgi:hypothetical protein
MSVGSYGGMILTGVNRISRRKPVPVPLCPPQLCYVHCNKLVFVSEVPHGDDTALTTGQKNAEEKGGYYNILLYIVCIS